MDSDHRRFALIPVILMTVVPDEPAEWEAQRERWAQLLSDLYGAVSTFAAAAGAGGGLLMVALSLAVWSRAAEWPNWPSVSRRWDQGLMRLQGSMSGLRSLVDAEARLLSAVACRPCPR